MPPVTRQMVSRPLWLVRRRSLLFSVLLFFLLPASPLTRGLALPQISDVDEGVVEGGEDASNAENELAWKAIC